MDEKVFIPRVVLTNFQISDKPVFAGGDSPLKESISVAKALTLSHSQNILSFEFAALSYSEPDRTRYRYRLARLESEWHEVASTQHFARYSKVAPGEYIFQVQARTGRGKWTEKGAEVRIVILPPLWATWPFRAAYILAARLMVWLSWRIRVRQVARQLNLGFEERLRERTRIARELHDTLLHSSTGCCSVFRRLATCSPGAPRRQCKLSMAPSQRTEQAIAEGRMRFRTYVPSRRSPTNWRRR